MGHPLEVVRALSEHSTDKALHVFIRGVARIKISLAPELSPDLLSSLLLSVYNRLRVV